MKESKVDTCRLDRILQSKVQDHQRTLLFLERGNPLSQVMRGGGVSYACAMRDVTGAGGSYTALKDERSWPAALLVSTPPSQPTHALSCTGRAGAGFHSTRRQDGNSRPWLPGLFYNFPMGGLWGLEPFKVPYQPGLSTRRPSASALFKKKARPFWFL